MVEHRFAILQFLVQKRAVAGHAQILIRGFENGAGIEGVARTGHFVEVTLIITFGVS